MNEQNARKKLQGFVGFIRFFWILQQIKAINELVHPQIHPVEMM